MSEKRKREGREDSPEEEEEEEISRPIKPIPATKLQAFTVGFQKKTAFQRHKEELDLKKQQESEEAAKVYKEFVASFEEPTSYKLGTTSFIKSGTLRPTDSVEDDYDRPSFSNSTTTTAKTAFKPMAFVKAGDSTLTNNITSSPSSSAKHLEDSDEEEEVFAKMKEAKLQKKRNLDSFLEEIKKGQEVRTRVDSKVGNAVFRTQMEESGSHDDGNPNTTNLYVGNINPTMTETGLCLEFGKYGPIASVKIMWPRTQEEKDKGNNCGFVSFMKRNDAAEAMHGLDGKDVEGFALRVGWGKAVPLPPQPFFVLDKQQPININSGLPFNAQISCETSGVNSRPRAEIHVVKPLDIKLMRIIHRLIERVLEHGPPFEALIMGREKDNPMFKFLFDNTSPEHIYYRWKLYSLLQGDTKTRWFDEPFQMFEGGPWWIPPELPLIDQDSVDPLFDTDDELAEQDNVTKGTLGQIAKQRLAIILREVTFQRGTIARAMAFAIDHSEAATEIVDIVCKSIVVPDSPLSVKLARLYLASDILHNSSVHVSNAWKYRKEFEANLPVVFGHFNTIYRSINARLKAEQVRRHISAVITVWENWMIFPKFYTDQLTEIFLRRENNGSNKQSSPLAATADVDEEPEQEEDKVIDNSRIEKDNNAMADDIDGEPMDDDVDGEPFDDDIDGEPMEEDLSQNDTAIAPELDDVSDMFS